MDNNTAFSITIGLFLAVIIIILIITLPVAPFDPCMGGGFICE